MGGLGFSTATSHAFWPRALKPDVGIKMGIQIKPDLLNSYIRNIYANQSVNSAFLPERVVRMKILACRDVRERKPREKELRNRQNFIEPCFMDVGHPKKG